MKHTQGEWKVRFFGDKDDGENMFFVEAPNLNMPQLGYGIEIMQEDYGEHNGYPREQRLADAKLIAAAPELLDIVKRCLPLLHNYPEGTLGYQLAKDALSVIKKATE